MNGFKAHNSACSPSIEITDNRILIYQLAANLENGVSYLKQFPDSEYERICLDAFEMGFLCLQTAQMNRENGLVKQQMESLVFDFKQAVQDIAKSFEYNLVNQIGTENGQLLAPLRVHINQTSEVLTEKLNGVSSLLTQDIDPTKETSFVGRFFRVLQNLLDPKRSDSIQGAFKEAIVNVTKENGTLAVSVKSVVAEAVKPLAEQVEKLGREIRDKQVTQEVLEQTTAKGISYENLVVTELQNWSKLSGAEVEHIGSDNDTGDILVKLTSKSLAAIELSVVIEARNRPSKRFGRQAITQHLSEAMIRRGANAAVFLSHSREGLALEIGDWAEGTCEQGFWIATTHQFLIIAIRFLTILQRLNVVRNSQSSLDITAIEGQLSQMRTAIGRTRTIKRYLTEIEKSVVATKAETDALSTDIHATLKSIEQILSIPSNKF
jgi:hypothetical protein